jgi:F0F1-type ATP synthase assembly protein I
MSYQKQMKKSRQDEIKAQKQKSGQKANNAYNQSKSGMGWKTFLGLILIFGCVVGTLNKKAIAAELCDSATTQCTFKPLLIQTVKSVTLSPKTMSNYVS